MSDDELRDGPREFPPDDLLNDELLARALGRPEATERRAWNTEPEWRRLRGRIAADDAIPTTRHAPSRRDPWRHVPASVPRLVAAAALVAAAIGGTVLVRRDAEPSYRTVSTARGQRLSLELDDGSSVVLGPASTLRYALTSTRRQLELQGLGHFRVTHDSARPFVVRAGSAEAVDLGTAFTVRAFPEDSAVTVAVTEGVVELRSSQATAALRAGEVGVATAEGVTRSSLPASRYGEWTEGRLQFDDVPLSRVASELSRWFDTDVRIDDPALAARRISASYADPTLESVLAALARTTGAHVVRTPAGASLRLLPVPQPR